MSQNTDWLRDLAISHRALHNLSKGLIENTKSAVSLSIKNGFAIEVDLQLSKDNEAIVFHDESLERLTTASGLLKDKTVSELKKVRFRGTRDRMQTLSELLKQVDGQVPLILEVKSQWDNLGPLETRIVEVLKDYKGRVCVMSFDPRSIILFRQLNPHLLRGLVSERFSDSVEWHMLSAWQRFSARHLLSFPRSRPHFIAYHVKALPSFSTRVAKRVGLPLLSWTVRTKEDLDTVARYADSPIFEGKITKDIQKKYIT